MLPMPIIVWSEARDHEILNALKRNLSQTSHQSNLKVRDRVIVPVSRAGMRGSKKSMCEAADRNVSVPSTLPSS